jgi:hypothetical protein
MDTSWERLAAEIKIATERRAGKHGQGAGDISDELVTRQVEPSDHRHAQLLQATTETVVLCPQSDQRRQRKIEAPAEIVVGEQQVPQPWAGAVVQWRESAGQGVVPDGEHPDLGETKERSHAAQQCGVVQEDARDPAPGAPDPEP